MTRAFGCLGSISTANGSALVRIGETTVVCGVKAEIAEPDLDAPSKGFLGEYGLLLLSKVSLMPVYSTQH